MLGGEKLRIAGNISVTLSFAKYSESSWLYKSDKTVDGFYLYQDPVLAYEGIKSMKWSKDYFVY